jgi:hypothetical protein
VPKCTPDSLEISVIKIESLKGLNQLKPITKKYYNYSNYTSITYTTLGYFYMPNWWHIAQESRVELYLALIEPQSVVDEFSRFTKILDEEYKPAILGEVIQICDNLNSE